jgi:hypothetical protein
MQVAPLLTYEKTPDFMNLNADIVLNIAQMVESAPI